MTAPAERRCRLCGATSGLRRLIGSPLSLDGPAWECSDGCPKPGRTQAEILARFHAAADTDWLGFRREVLMDSMTLNTLRKALPDLDTKGLRDDYVKPEDLEQKARDYLTFAIGKIVGHRGISASRSVDKLREYAWLLGRDDVVSATESAEYENYGAPQVRAFAEGMGWPWPGDVAEYEVSLLERMSTGLPCRPDCEDGCGR